MSNTTDGQRTDSEPRLLDPAIIESTKLSLAADIPEVAIVDDGTFFNDPNYFDSLPQDAKVVICAVQKTGPHPFRPTFCNDYALKTLADFDRSNSRDRLETAISLYAMAVKYMTANDPKCTKYVHDLARALQRKWEAFNNHADLDSTIDWYRKTVIIAGDSSPDLYSYLCDVAVTLSSRLRLRECKEDFEEARANYERSCTLTTGLPVHPIMLSNYGEFIRIFSTSLPGRRLDLITKAVDLQLQAVRIIEEANSSSRLPYGHICCNVSNAFQDRFNIVHSEDDLGLGFEYLAKAQAHANARDSIFCLTMSSFADFLRQRAAATADREVAQQDLNRAWDLLQQSLQLIPPNFDDSGLVLDRCSSLCAEKFHRGGNLKDLDDAIEFSRRATTFPGPDNWNFHRNLSFLLLLRHQRGNRTDLDLALPAIKSAIRGVQTDTPDHRSCLWYLGKIYRAMYDEKRELEFLEDAIKEFTAAERPLGESDHSRVLTRIDLGNAYCALFEHSKRRSDLDTAVSFYKSAVADLHRLYPIGTHPDEALLYSMLGQERFRRYQYWNSAEDLDSAITYIHKSLQAVDESNPAFSVRANNLGYALIEQYLVRKDDKTRVKFLTEAQDVIRRALEGPIQLNSSTVNNLHTLMGIIYHLLGGLANLDLAIEHYDIALQYGDVGRASIGTTSLDIAEAIKEKAEITNAPEDYRHAMSSYDNASKVLQEDDPIRWTVRLGNAYLLKNIYFRKILAEYNQLGERALEEFRVLVNRPTLETRQRILACSAAAQLVSHIKQDPAEARNFLVLATSLLPEAVLLHSNRLEQLRLVREFHFLPSIAAATSLAAGDPASSAIQLLEKSRGLIWDRLLNQKSVIDDLKEVDEELYEQFREVRDELNKQPTPTEGSTEATPIFARKDEIRMQRHHIAERYMKLLETIRQKAPNFLRLPGDLSLLQEHGMTGPIVYINDSNEGHGHALIITKQNIYNLPLPLFDKSNFTKNASLFMFAVNNLRGAREEAKNAYVTAMKWIWEAIAKPVLDSIDFSQYDAGPTGKPRVFWVSTGWVSVIPIHAAGDFLEVGSETAVSESHSVHGRVISSYIPSLRALSFARERVNALRTAEQTKSSSQNCPTNAILIGMPTTPNMANSELDVEAEFASVTESLRGGGVHVPAPMLNVPLSAVQQVLEEYREEGCGILHFACHGVADRVDPSLSSLRLQDKPLNVRSILRMSLHGGPGERGCWLVYLSACESGMTGDIFLRDEGIHVTGAFQMAGVPYAVSALWKISDAVSVDVAASFYQLLRSGDGGGVDFGRSASALHGAVQRLRDRGVHPILWGPFIHSGA